MTKVFISYRREDAPGVAGLIFNHLLTIYPRCDLFMDFDAGSVPKRAHDSRALHCNLMLAIIGPRWLDGVDHDGQRRLSSDQDYVHTDIASALRRRIPVIAVLVDGAVLPAEDSLPKGLKSLISCPIFKLLHIRLDTDLYIIGRIVEELAPTRHTVWRFIAHAIRQIRSHLRVPR
jgi:hypothetical protein